MGAASSLTLIVGGVQVAACELAETRSARRRGLLGRDGVVGALLLRPCRSVHTIGMRFDLDVAYLAITADDGYLVSRVVAMRRGRIGRPAMRCRAVLEAEHGAFVEWGVCEGADITVVAS